MIAIPLVLIGLGWLIMMVGQIWLIVVAFRTSVMWGFLSLLVPFASLVFLIQYWAEAKQAFLTQVAGTSFMVLGMVLGMRMGINFMDRAARDGTLQAQVEQALAEQELAEAAGPSGTEPAAVGAPTAVTPVNPNDKLVGLRVGDLRELIGTPRARFQNGKRLTLVYEGMEVVADDGVHVSRVVYPE